MGHRVKNGSPLEKVVTLAKMGHTVNVFQSFDNFTYGIRNKENYF